MGKEHSSKPKPSARVLRLIEESSIADLRLISCSAEQNVKKDQPSQVELGVQVNAARDDEALAVTVAVQFSAMGKDPDDSLRINATFGVAYELPSRARLLDEDSKEFGRVAVQHLWPYWREFVQSMTTRMGLPVLRVPVLEEQALESDYIPGKSSRKTAKKNSRRKRK